MSRAGQVIVYCTACSTQVRGNEFLQGRAHKIKGQVFCGSCRPGRTPRQAVCDDDQGRFREPVQGIGPH